MEMQIYQLNSVADPHHVDTYPDPVPACHFDADPECTFHFDAQPDPDPSYQIKALKLLKLLK